MSSGFIVDADLSGVLDDVFAVAAKYLSQEPTGMKRLLYDPGHKSAEWRKIPLDARGEPMPAVFYRMLAGSYFDVLQRAFGADAVVDGTVTGSVGTGMAKFGSDIDGAIFVPDDAPFGEVIDGTALLHRYAQRWFGEDIMPRCNLNVFSLAVMGDLYLEGGMGLDIKGLKELVDVYR